MFCATKNHQLLVKDLTDIIRTFLPRQGTPLDMESTSDTHIFSRGDAKALCTVKLHTHGMYNIEFVFQYWLTKLKEHKSSLYPVFMISNNGVSTTLKGFLTETPDHTNDFGSCLAVCPNVELEKNGSVIISKGSFRAFKQTELYSSDLTIFQTITVLRAHITDRRTSLQFIIMRAEDSSRISDLIKDIMNTPPGRPVYIDPPQLTPPLLAIRHRRQNLEQSGTCPATDHQRTPSPSKSDKASFTLQTEATKRTCQLLTSWQWWFAVSMTILTLLILKYLMTLF
ncbi:BFRF1 [Vombatid gammaherpesvirus 1]|uniref:BFRF1 n=1 Tax=Vombatid gammaherpesvirus 1 TaxID=2052651 RepID=A0A3Q8J601_9GAMA|nr:BFRF1 [Vombatid gammaherpesvirus 1]AZB49166.1 BFRF1 [Vombatid gammaherpesvirus 1]